MSEGASIWVNIYSNTKEERLQPDSEPFKVGTEVSTNYEGQYGVVSVEYDGYKTLRLQPSNSNEYWTVELTYTIQSENLTWKL
jgi:hypothetical protein